MQQIHVSPPHRYLVRFHPKRMPHVFTDVLILGSGIAGVRAANDRVLKCIAHLAEAKANGRSPQAVIIEAQKWDGDAGKHARAAVSVNGLPLGVSVEVQMVLEVRD